jgi:hypothetical protein
MNYDCYLMIHLNSMMKNSLYCSFSRHFSFSFESGSFYCACGEPGSQQTSCSLPQIYSTHSMTAFLALTCVYAWKHDVPSICPSAIIAPQSSYLLSSYSCCSVQPPTVTWEASNY